MDSLKEYSEQIDYWRANPIDFFYDALRVDYLTNQQEDLAKDLAQFVYANTMQRYKEEYEEIRDNPRTRARREPRMNYLKSILDSTTLTPDQEDFIHKAGFMISAGRDLGKSATMALVSIWFLTCFDRPQGYIIAPTGQQAKSILMSEIDMWVNRKIENFETGEYEDAFIFKELFQVTSERFFYKKAPLQRFMEVKNVPDNRSEQEQRASLSGFHSPDQMVIVDEAVAFPDHVFTTLNATNSGPLNWMMASFNPLSPSSYACRAVFGKEAEVFVAKRWNGEDSDKPGMKETIAQRVKEYGGTNNDLYRVNVQGLPPEEGDDAMFPISRMESATNRIPVFPQSRNINIGHDVAGEGADDACTAICVGYDLQYIYLHQGKDEYYQTAFLYDLIQKFRDFDTQVTIDSTGIGRAVFLMLKQKAPQFRNIFQFKGNESPLRNTEKYLNKRAEGYWELHHLFKKQHFSINLREGSSHLYRLKAELSATSSKTRLNDMREQIIPKDKIKEKLGGRSPDIADAVQMAVYRAHKEADALRPVDTKIDYWDERLKKEGVNSIHSRYNKMAESTSWMGV